MILDDVSISHPAAHLVLGYYSHISALSFPADVAELFAENLELYNGADPALNKLEQQALLRRTLKYPVHWENGY